MDNKLSELSKPVAWVTMQREFCDEERTVITNPIDAEKYNLECYDLTTLHSQEYVSALLAELEAKDKRIRALDMRNADLNSTMERWATDRAESASRIDELEAKLATPVRLPAYRNSPDMHTKQYYEAIGFNQALDACGSDIRAAGFTVEGDE